MGTTMKLLRMTCLAILAAVTAVGCGDDDAMMATDGGMDVDAGGADGGRRIDAGRTIDAGSTMDDGGQRDAGRADAGPGDSGAGDSGAGDSGVGDGGAPDGGMPDAGTVMAFDCASLPAPVGMRVCDDFNGSFDQTWTTPQGGTWSLVSDRYQGMGTAAMPTPCGASLLAGSLVSGFSAADVRVTASLNPRVRDDAAIILRSAEPSNRIELNFRAGHPDGVSYQADLVVQELSACVQTLLTDPGVPAEHVFLPGNPRLGDTFEIVIELTGTRLVVWVNGMMALDDTFTFANTAAGGVGVGVVASPGAGGDAGETRFDYIIAESLD